MTENYDMNRTERIAYDYLKSLGYRNIKYNKVNSPDFETKDGRGWEVKTYPNYRFTDIQLHDMDYNTNIIFVDKSNEIFVRKFYEVCENDNGNISLGDLLIYSPCWRPVIENDRIIFAFADSLDREEISKKRVVIKPGTLLPLCSAIEEKINELNSKKPRPAILIGRKK